METINHSKNVEILQGDPPVRIRLQKNLGNLCITEIVVFHPEDFTYFNYETVSLLVAKVPSLVSE